MKRFVLDILFGFACFCVVWIIGEIVFDHYKGQNEYSYKYNYVKNNQGIRTLLIGHSHFENGLNPYLFGDSVFNFAIGGRGNWMEWDVMLAEDLYHTMPNLKTVIFPLGYNIVFESVHYRVPRTEGVEEYMYFYTKYMHAPYDCVPERFKYYSALLFNKCGPNYWLDEEVDSLGYKPFYGKMLDWENVHSVKDSAFYYGEIANKCYKEFVNSFKRLAIICKNNRIRLIAVTCPCSNSYIEKTRPDIIEKMVAVIGIVREEAPIEYYNYMNDEEFRADSLYFNSSHLNAFGADKFAIRLKNDLKL